MQNQQVSITGPATKICQSATLPSQINIQGQVEIQGQEGKSLKGTLSSIPGIPGNVEFTAQRQPPAKKVE
jgi:hypothetical protein